MFSLGCPQYICSPNSLTPIHPPVIGHIYFRYHSAVMRSVVYRWPKWRHKPTQLVKSVGYRTPISLPWAPGKPAGLAPLPPGHNQEHTFAWLLWWNPGRKRHEPAKRTPSPIKINRKLTVIQIPGYLFLAIVNALFLCLLSGLLECYTSSTNKGKIMEMVLVSTLAPSIMK